MKKTKKQFPKGCTGVHATPKGWAQVRVWEAICKAEGIDLKAEWKTAGDAFFERLPLPDGIEADARAETSMQAMSSQRLRAGLIRACLRATYESCPLHKLG